MPALASPGEASVEVRTLRAMLSMVGREVAIKALAFGGWIVMSRLLDPAHFGLFAVSSFMVNLFAVVSETGLGAAFVREKRLNEGDLDSLFTYQLAWSLLLALLGLAVSPFMGGMAGLGLVVGSLSLSLVIISARTVPSVLAQRSLSYAPIVVADLWAQGAFWAVAIGCGVAGLAEWAAPAAPLAYALVGTALLYSRTTWRPTLAFNWSAMRGKVGFSLLYQGQQGAGLLKYAMLPALGAIAGARAGVGYVTWAHQLAVVPMQIAQVVSRVSFPAMARLQDEPAAFVAMARDIVKWMCRLTFPACALLIGLGPQLALFVYGEKWLPAMPLLYLFAVNTALNMPVNVLLSALFSLGRGAGAFRTIAGMVGLTWLAALLALWAGAGLLSAPIGFIVGMLFALGAVVYELRDYASLSFVRPLLIPAAVSAGGALALQAMASAWVGSLGAMLAALVVGGGAMLAGSMWGDYRVLGEVARWLPGRLRTVRSRSTRPGEQEGKAGRGTA